ncbi:glycerophosphodiester phosphodiesterase family protein [Virgibacillus sp. W0181]|uniref:glycerophosphodiester phosphodiesterase family protein n=1 Tax=Virgibacillus sp. W0181 TaxID=3391581 RepID=UPI003F471436
MVQMFKNSLEDFKLSYIKYLSFELIYSFLGSVIFVPILTYLYNQLFMMVGKGQALLNNEVYKLGLSFEGLLGLFIVSFVAVSILFVELGAIILIAQKSYFRQPVYISDAFVTSMKKLPKLLGFGIFQLFFLLLLGIPFLDASTLPPLLDLNITILITDFFQETLTAKVIYLALFIGVIYLYLRWIFALHFIFIKNKSIYNAMKASWKLTELCKFRIIMSLIVWNILFIGIGFLIVTLLSRLGIVIDSKVIGDFIGNYLQMFSSYITIVLSFFFIPMNIIILTRMFYKSQGESGIEVSDCLDLDKSILLSRVESTINRMIPRGKTTLTTLAVILFTAVFLFNYVIQDSIVYLRWDVAVAGHRGDGFNAPENSISSIHSVIEKGADAVEIDVTLTKDDVLVLSHDLDLMRTAGIPSKISDLTYEELKDIDIGRLYDESYAGEKIPTLDEALALTVEKDIGVIIDVKTERDEAVYAKELARLIEKHDAKELASVQSFNQHLLKLIREHNSEIQLGQILYLSAGNLSGLDVDFYTVRESMLTNRFIKRAKKENRKIWVWTVNNERNIKEVLSYDINGIITDYPEKVQRIIGVRPDEEEAIMR